MADESAEEGDLGRATLVLSTEDAEYNLGIDDAQERAMAMDKVFEETHAAIKSRFAERFEHAGIFMFSRQVLGLAGLSDVARHTMGVITLGFEEVATAAGIATTSLAPLLLAAGAGILIFEKMAGGHHKAAESLEDLHKQQAEALGTTVDLELAMGKYQNTVGPLPGSLDKLRDATEKLDESQRRHLMTTEALQMKAAQETIASNQAEIDAIKAKQKEFDNDEITMRQYGATTADFQREAKGLADRLKELEEANTKATQSFEQAKADIKAQGEGYKDAGTKLKDLADAHDRAGKAAKKHAEEEAAAMREIRKNDDETERAVEASAQAVEEARRKLTDHTKILLDEEQAAVENAYARKAAEIRKFEDQQRAAIEETYDLAVRKAQETGVSIVQLTQQRDAAINQLEQTVAARNRQNLTEMGQAWHRFGQQIENDVSMAAARTIVEQTSAVDAVKNLSKMAAEQLIADYIRAGIQHTISMVKRTTETTTASTTAVAAAAATSKAEIAATTAVAAARASASAASLASIEAQTVAVVKLTAALGAATTAALALDAALVAAA
jgi:hypothetical protein